MNAAITLVEGKPLVFSSCVNGKIIQEERYVTQSVYTPVSDSGSAVNRERFGAFSWLSGAKATAGRLLPVAVSSPFNETDT